MLPERMEARMAPPPDASPAGAGLAGHLAIADLQQLIERYGAAVVIEALACIAEATSHRSTRAGGPGPWHDLQAACDTFLERQRG